MRRLHTDKPIRSTANGPSDVLKTTASTRKSDRRSGNYQLPRLREGIVGVGAFTHGTLVLPAEEWSIILTTRPNVLVEGPVAAIEAVLRALIPHCREPLSWWGDGPPVGCPPTLIVDEMAKRGANDQRRLLDWLSAGDRRTQVISLSSLPLFAMVERGLFLADLYYRLNIVRLEVARPA